MAKLWTMKTGEKIAVKDMETSHIENSLAMLKRKGFVGPKTLAFYASGPEPQGEMAMMCYEQECEEIFNAPVSSFIDYFEEELERRK